MVSATRITRDVVQNSYYKDIIGEVEKVIQKGDPMSSVFNKYENFYPPYVSEMVSVGATRSSPLSSHSTVTK